MPDATPSPVSEGDACPAPQALTRDQIDTLLADFRAWLEQMAPAPAELIQPPAEAPDLHTLLAQFTALRHEVNLQTRSSRTQQEHAAEALRQLQEALDALHQARNEAADHGEAEQEEMLRPLLKTLVDTYDALSLARREIQRVRENVLPELRALTQAAPETEPTVPAPQGRTLWQRLFGAPPVTTAPPAPAGPDRQQLAQAAGRIEQMITALLTGYTMSMQRLERALEQNELVPIPTAGQAFDPERMEVVEVVTEPGRTATEVTDEVRRGYVWRGRVFRFAQVRVARPEG